MNDTEGLTVTTKSNQDARPANSRQSSARGSTGTAQSKSSSSDRQSAEAPRTKDKASTTDSSTDSKNETQAKNMESTEPVAESETRAENGPGIDLSPEIQRAEALLDEFGHRAGGQLTDLVRALFRTAVRAREEAEDIWAEANSIRRGH